MKLLLIKPPSKTHIIVPPIGLAYLASSTKKEIPSIEIKILDCLNEKYNLEKFKEFILTEKPDIIGITAMSYEINTALAYVKIAKKINPSIITILGGAHVSCCPAKVLKNKELDFIIAGEAEHSLPKLIQELQSKRHRFNKIPGLGYKKNNQIYLNKQEFIKNLDDLPFPDFDILKIKSYPKTYISKRYPTIPIITSRGCPFNCTFCAGHKVSGKVFRARSPENIIQEIKELKERYKIKEFQIWDDNFTFDRKRAERFIDLLIEEKINLDWWCPNGLRLETLDKELLVKLKKSGCYAIVFGIESGSDKIQKDMNKNLNLEHLREMVSFSSRIGIKTRGFFIIGYPTETKQDILKTITLAKELKLDRASFFLFTPILGSEICHQLTGQMKLSSRFSPENTQYSIPSVLPRGIKSLKELKSLHRKAILDFYIRPRIFLRFFAENFSLSQIMTFLILIKKYFIGKTAS